MLVDRKDLGDPKDITKWVLFGIFIGASTVLIAQLAFLLIQ